jgi:hypothetical protein
MIIDSSGKLFGKINIIDFGGLARRNSGRKA